MTYRLRHIVSLQLLATIALLFDQKQVSSFQPTSIRPLPGTFHRPRLPTIHVQPHHDTQPIAKNKNNLPTTTTFSPTTTSTSLRMNFSPPGDNDPTGLKEGFVLFGVVLLLNIWLFSVPPEYRRARFCSEEDVASYPDSKCTTFKAWRTGIVDYYANGGGVKFDFSIDPDSRK